MCFSSRRKRSLSRVDNSSKNLGNVQDVLHLLEDEPHKAILLGNNTSAKAVKNKQGKI